MIEYKLNRLDNGLTVIAHRDTSTKIAALNIIYKVGSRDENPSRTGFAHLFEHLMFRGTKRIPDFDRHVQEACGEDNAFTSNDYTDYYMVLPKDNIETALWLESDRMRGLNITREALETEKRVVIEEYNQRYLNRPYGDMLILLRGMAYKTHPYRWATIGKNIEHIERATLPYVKRFYKRWYNPSNAILSVAADIDEDRIIELAGKWFGDIDGHPVERNPLPAEPEQTAPRRMEVRRKVPARSITVAFKMGRRTDREYYLCDFMTDLLSGGTSARLYRSLVKERPLFSAINAYVSGDMDPGLLIITGHLLPDTNIAQGEEALWGELEKLKTDPVSEYEMEKVKNKFEAGIIFGELNVMNKALNLGFYNMLGDMSLLNGEVGIFRSITPEEIASAASSVFDRNRSSTLIYDMD